MKKNRLANLPLKAPAGKENDLSYWKGIVDRQMSMLRSYKSRQDDIVLCLGRIQKRPDLADVMIQGLLETTPAVASKRVRDREEALAVAVYGLTLLKDELRAATALDAVKRLCPDLFPEPETPKDPEIE
jgi:hypothetical protein